MITDHRNPSTTTDLYASLTINYNKLHIEIVIASRTRLSQAMDDPH